MSDYGSGKFKTKYGTIHIHNPGSVHKPENLVTIKRVKGKRPILGGKPVDGPVYSKSAGDIVLQRPAAKSFLDAEKRATSRRLRRKGKRNPIIITGVGYRSYASQKSLFYGPDNSYGQGTRFAHPDGSLHVEALAIDNHMGFFQYLRKKAVKAALVACGWHFAVSGEPWHASYHRSG